MDLCGECGNTCHRCPKATCGRCFKWFHAKENAAVSTFFILYYISGYTYIKIIRLTFNLFSIFSGVSTKKWKEDSERVQALFVCVTGLCPLRGAQFALIQPAMERPVEQPMERPLERPMWPKKLALREQDESTGLGIGKHVIRAPIGYTPSPTTALTGYLEILAKRIAAVIRNLKSAVEGNLKLSLIVCFIKTSCNCVRNKFNLATKRMTKPPVIAHHSQLPNMLKGKAIITYNYYMFKLSLKEK